MTSEEIKNRIKYLEMYALISERMSRLCIQSMERSFWYIRPSHTRIMKRWAFINKMFEEFLETKNS